MFVDPVLLLPYSSYFFKPLELYGIRLLQHLVVNKFEIPFFLHGSVVAIFAFHILPAIIITTIASLYAILINGIVYSADLLEI